MDEPILLTEKDMKVFILCCPNCGYMANSDNFQFIDTYEITLYICPNCEGNFEGVINSN